MPSEQQQPEETGASSTNSPEPTETMDEVLTSSLKRREGIRRLAHLQAIESMTENMATEDEFVRRDFAMNERALWGDEASDQVGPVAMPDGEDDEMRLTSAGDINISFGDRKDPPPTETSSPEPVQIDASSPGIDYEAIRQMIASNQTPSPSLASRVLPWALATLGLGGAAGVWMNSGGDPQPDTNTEYELRLGGEDGQDSPRSF